MGIVINNGVALASGSSWKGVYYFTTLRSCAGVHERRTIANTAPAGVSLAPYDALNLGLHVGDDPEAVGLNRKALYRLLPQPPVWLEQVHGVNVFDADGGVPSGWDPQRPPVADAAVSCSPGKVLCVLSADCLPVVLVNTQATVLGVAHAGWRGLASGVLENTLAAMKAKTTFADTWRAWIGPGISQAAFEVGADVRSAFVEDDAATDVFFMASGPQKWHADLPGLASWRLARAGVAQVQTSKLCTYEEPSLFYSYRRESQTGRMATLAWLD